MRYVRIPLHVTEIDALIRIGRLKEDSRTDAEVLQAAVLSLVYQALGESEIGRPGNASLRVTISKADSVTCNGPWHKEGVRVTGKGVRDQLPDQGYRLGGRFAEAPTRARSSRNGGRQRH